MAGVLQDKLITIFKKSARNWLRTILQGRGLQYMEFQVCRRTYLVQWKNIKIGNIKVIVIAHCLLNSAYYFFRVSNIEIKGSVRVITLQVIVHSSTYYLHRTHFEDVSITALLVPPLNGFTTPMNNHFQFTVAVLWENSNNIIPELELVVTAIKETQDIN